MRIPTFMMKFWKWNLHWLMDNRDKRYSKYLIIACIWAGYSFFASCSPDSGIGANVLPDNNTLNANFTDGTTVKTSVILEDSVNTTNVNSFFLGSYNDPIFGETKASIYAQLAVPTNGANPFTVVGNPGSNTNKIILDSVVFAMPYVYTTPNYFGTLSPQTIQVYLLDNNIIIDTTYYSNSVLSHKTLLGQASIRPNITEFDSTRYSNTRVEPCPIYNYPRFKIRLSQKWGQSWLDSAMSGVLGATGPGNDTILLNQAAFIRHMKGLYITANSPMQFPGQGGIWYMNLYDAGAGVFFYMRIINNNFADTVYSIPQFTFGTNQVMFMHYDHDYTKTSFYAPHKLHAPVSSPDNIYIQGFGGVETRLDFPNLKTEFSGPVIINRAEVDIPLETQDIGDFALPAQLYLIGINDTSTVPSTSTFTLPDEYTSFYNGTYDAFNQAYEFDIAEYVQNVIDGKTIEDGLYLVPGSSAISPDRLVGYGGAVRPGVGSNKRLRLRLYYTPLNTPKIQKVKTIEMAPIAPAKTMSR